jgi:DNA-binding transcriptional LysR family regulator
MGYQIGAELKKGELVRVLEAYEPDSRPLQLVTQTAHVTPKVRSFLDFAATALEKIDAAKKNGSA